MEQIKALIIDDEWLIRDELKHMLSHYPQVLVVGEAKNVEEAIRLFNEFKPELIFLDIQLSGKTGFDFINSVKGDFKLVFLTAFDQYLEKTRKFKPVDYLMKPVSKEKLNTVIQKLSPGQGIAVEP